MPTESVQRVLPYTPEQLFDLAADVERYPEFLRWWIMARVRKREGNVYHTEQVLGLGPIHVEFGSRTELRRPERIDVTSDERPFRQFKLSWIFEPRGSGGCRVTLIAAFDLDSHLMKRLVERVLPIVVAETIAAFEARAGQLYGTGK